MLSLQQLGGTAFHEPRLSAEREAEREAVQGLAKKQQKNRKIS
jgi:hypothetical protein